MNKENLPLTNYEIKGIIGKGSFSKVKLAINKITKEKVAIKIIDKKFILKKNNSERIKREISILKNTSHPNIIKVIETIEDTNKFYFIMEYCQYGELYLQIVDNKRFDENKASFYFYQIINGLNYLHNNKIIHRDLKPENILLSEGNILKIIDFGLSNYISENQYLDTPCGSPSYAAPEMIMGTKYNGFLSDIWSCGVILYVMLCGYLPFEGFNNNDLFKKILKGKVYYPNNIDKSAVDLMKNILVVNPEKRIDINKIKKHPFYLRGKSIFNEKFPHLIKEVEQESIAGVNKTLKKSISDSNNNKIKNKINNNYINSENEVKNNKKSTLSESVNKNHKKKDNNNIEKKNNLNNNENSVYNNLLFHTKNINYYKKILSGELKIHNIRRKNKNKIDDNDNDNDIKNNEITPKNNKICEKYNLSNSKLNKYNNSISKNSEKISSYKSNRKNNHTNSVNHNSKANKKKDLKRKLKNIPYQKNNIKKEKNEKSNLIKSNNSNNMQQVSEEKKRISLLSYNENSSKPKNECQTPNYLLVKKLLKNAQASNEEEKDNKNFQESYVNNAKKETQIFSFNHTDNKITKLKRVYENKIDNASGNEINQKECLSKNKSNSNFQINNINENVKEELNTNIKQNNNYNIEMSPIRKIGFIFNSLNSNEKKNSCTKLCNHKSCRNTKNINCNNNEIIVNNKYNRNENRKNTINKNEIKINNKKLKNDKNTDININDFSPRNSSNHPNLYIKSLKNNSKNKNKIIQSEQNSSKYNIININTLEKIPSLNKNKKNLSQNKNDFNSIKVNKKSMKNKRNDKNEKKQALIQQNSLTNKLKSIKKNFNLYNKDIFLLESKKEDSVNYLISCQNKKIETTRSQKFIKNRSLAKSININNNNKKELSKNKNQNYNENSYIVDNNNNNIYSEKNIRQIKINKSKKEICKSDNKPKINGAGYNRNKYLKKNIVVLYNDENQNCNNKGQSKNHRSNKHHKKNYKYTEKSTFDNEYSNL